MTRGDFAVAVAVAAAGGNALLRVRVTPRAKVTRLDGLHGQAVRVRVAAPPADGKANSALLAFLAAALGVRRRDLELVQGAKGRDKTVRVRGLDAATVAARLEAVQNGS